LQVDAVSGLEERYGIRSFDDLETALNERPDAVLICNPSSLHMPIALAAARAGCHLFIEKPLSHSLEQIEELASLVRQRSLVCMVGYQLRFHPCLKLAHQLLTDGAIGRPLACRATVGEYLPGWHRYEDYRAMYASRRDLGGGVVLSQIHEIDVLYWFFGRPSTIVSMGGQFSDLELDVEDVASTLFGYDRFVAHLHQDYLQQPATRQMEVIGSGGRMTIDLRALSVRVYGRNGEITIDDSFEGFERNELFLDEMRAFTGAVVDGTPVPVDLADGRQSLEMAVAMQRSLEMRMPIAMDLAG
jgi:predicted dehydrogenase